MKIETQPAGNLYVPASPIAEPLLQKRLPSLDGLRFVAATLVIVYHAGLMVPAPDGVTFFYVLSGFLFAVLLDREYDRTGRVDLKKFYLRRTFRILPAFYATLLFTIVTKLLLENPVDFSHVTSSGLFVGNYYNAAYGHPPTGFSHFGSLAVEEQFYLIWPLTFVALAGISRRALIYFLFGTAAVVCAYRVTIFQSGLATDAYLYNAIECRFDSLAIGCLLGLLIKSQKFRQAIPHLCRTGLEPLLVVALLMVSSTEPNSVHHTTGFAVDSWLLGLLLLQLIVLGQHPLWRWLNWKPVQFLGTLSYSAYLLHAWGIALAEKVGPTNLPVKLMIAVSVTMVLAAIQFYLVERPALRWRDRYRAAGGSG